MNKKELEFILQQGKGQHIGLYNPSSLINSEVVNTLNEDCFFRALSSDNNGMLLESESAIKGASSGYETSLNANLMNFLKSSSGTMFIIGSKNAINTENSYLFMPDLEIISCLCAKHSEIICSQAYNPILGEQINYLDFEMKQDDLTRRDLTEQDEIRLPELENNLFFVGIIMMYKSYENDSIPSNLENKNKGANLNSFVVTKFSSKIFEMLNGSLIASNYLFDLFINSNGEIPVFSFKFAENYSQFFRNLKTKTHFSFINLSNSPKVIRSEGSFLAFLSSSMNSSLKGSQSIGYQPILSQNSWSASDSAPVLMNLSNISFLRASSLPTSDQFTHKNLSTFAFNSLSKEMVTLTIYISPLLTNCSNFSSCLTFFSIPALITSDQFTSGILSNLCLSSFGIDNVSFAIFSPFINKQNIVNKGNIVSIFKSFDSEQSETFFVDAFNNVNISATAQNQILRYGMKKWQAKFSGFITNVRASWTSIARQLNAAQPVKWVSIWLRALAGASGFMPEFACQLGVTSCGRYEI